MVWMPGVDEIPISIGWQNDEEFRLGIANVGDCSGAIFDRIKVGDRLGIRGPFGTSFDLKDYKKIMLVGGGIGTPPMLRLAQDAAKKGIEVITILGARTKDLLIYEKEFEDLGCDVHLATDDGSIGCKGYCTNVMADKLLNHKVDAVYTCGPELMIEKVARMAKEADVDCQVCLERYMKCGFGVCGQCCMDDSGLRICKDGPVIDGLTALKMSEFGKYTRTASGMIKNF